jgi:hypothetical protein
MLELAALKLLQRASVDNEARLKQASSDNFKSGVVPAGSKRCLCLYDGHLAILGDILRHKLALLYQCQLNYSPRILARRAPHASSLF